MVVAEWNYVKLQGRLVIQQSETLKLFVTVQELSTGKTRQSVFQSGFMSVRSAIIGI
jgi:hypothetical protein